MNVFQQVPCWGVAVTVGLLTGLFYTNVPVDLPKEQPLRADGHSSSCTDNGTRLTDPGAHRLELSSVRPALPPAQLLRPLLEDGSPVDNNLSYWQHSWTCPSLLPPTGQVTSTVRASNDQTLTRKSTSILPGVWSAEESCCTNCGTLSNTCPRSSSWISEEDSTDRQPLDILAILLEVLVPALILLLVQGIRHRSLRRKPWKIHRAVPGHCLRQQHRWTVLRGTNLLRAVLPNRRDFICQTVVAILLPGVWPSLLVWVLTALWDLHFRTGKGNGEYS